MALDCASRPRPGRRWGWTLAEATRPRRAASRCAQARALLDGPVHPRASHASYPHGGQLRTLCQPPANDAPAPVSS